MRLKRSFIAMTVLALMFLFNANAMAQIPSDAAILPYEVDEVTNIISERFESPNETNEYIDFLLEEQDFPVIASGQALSAESRTQLSSWVETHPAQIEQLLIRCKKNYDQYFNPALINQQ